MDGAIGGNNRGGGLGYFAIVMILQLVFGLLASLIVMAFSRGREFRADAGGAKLAGRDRMIAALQRLQLAARRGRLAEGDGGVRHFRRQPARIRAAVDEPSAAGRTHRCVAQRAGV